MLEIPGRWRRIPPLAYLLTATAALYLWGLGASGWANAYYSAAAQAGAQSWSAFFFGSFDAAGSITVDKPPLALWPMALSVRVFGLSSWSILVPQALLGVATVAVVHAGVRRATGSSSAALLAGAALALTPVAVLMFRFNNPDGLLILLLAGAAVATLRAVDSPRAVRWLVLAGSLVGLAFLTKMLQAFLVLPALAATYAVFAVVPWRRRLLHLLAAAGAVVVGGSWWVVAVELWPAGSRPWIGGSQHNSVIELVLGYNGVGRLTGEQTGAVSNSGGWGNASLLRLLDPGTGGQIAWLLPAALILAIAALTMTRRSEEPTRPALVLWLVWAVVTWLTFSLMGGIFHDYYTVALAPAVASLLGLGAHVVWQHRSSPAATRVLGAAVVATGGMAVVVLWPERGWQPWIPVVVVAAALVAGVQVVVAHRRSLPLGAGFVAVALVVAFTGPAAYSVATVASPHSGAVPHAGPSGGSASIYVSSQVGNLLSVSTSSPRLTRLLVADAEEFTWVAAVTGANSAAGFQLATGRPVMPIGGFNGTDPSPSPATFRRLVRDDLIHFYIAGGGLLMSEAGDLSAEVVGEGPVITRTGSNASLRIDRWVTRHFAARTVDGVTVYDLTRPSRAGGVTVG